MDVLLDVRRPSILYCYTLHCHLHILILDYSECIVFTVEFKKAQPSKYCEAQRSDS